MRLEPFIIFGLLIVIAIQLVIILFTQKRWGETKKHLEERFIKYLHDLDMENQRLKTGISPEKARKDYKKLLVN
ncbi:MAG TPA: hypothetical protein VE090_02120 [Methylomirabilota bacterium]|nr:hypothetical protein [Methylomirabilota bacterium]